MKILRRTLIVILFAVISSHTYAQLGGGIFSNSAKRIWGLGAAALPANCTAGDVFVPNAPVVGIYLCTATDVWTLAGPGAAVMWGGITGTLSNQMDLQNALNLKAPLASPVFTGQPTIPDFTLSPHTHLNAAGGGVLTESAVTNLVTDLAAKLAASANLSDLANAGTARTNLGLGTLATQSGTFSGASSGTNTGDQTITLTSDVTGAGTGSFAATIAAGAVTLAKQANMATASVVYRKTAGSGAPEVNTLATLKTDLGLTGTNSGDQTITLTGGVTGSGTGSFAATVMTNANLTGPITSVGNATTIAPNPAVTGLTSDTISTSANAGIGVIPNATSGRRLDVLQTGNQLTVLDVRNSDAADAGAAAVSRAVADTAVAQIVAYGTVFSATVFGVNIGGWSSLNNAGAGSGLLIGTTNSTPIRFGTNSALSMLVDTSQGVTFSGAIIPSQTIGITGTTTNNNANAGAFGEYQTGTVAANTTSLSTGTTANVGTNTNITLTAGDWDCTGVVNFTFGATTSITNLTGGISTTTGTLPAQDSYFDFETSAIIPTGTAVATWVVPTVRLSNSGSTNVFLVSQATFTASTIKVGGTIRCRRMR